MPPCDCTLPPETDILDAIGFLLEKRVTGAPVGESRHGRLIAPGSAAPSISKSRQAIQYTAESLAHEENLALKPIA